MRWNNILEKQKQELTPVFASYESKLEFFPENGHIKASVIELNCLWNNYLALWEELQKNEGERELVCNSLQNHFTQISCKISEIGGILFALIDELESIQFQRKFAEFNKMQEKICMTACSILSLNRKSLTVDLLGSLSDVEYSLYKCLTEGQKVSKTKSIQQTNWIDPKQYGILKYLYRFCKYSIKDYLTVHKIVTQSMHQQRSVLFTIHMVQQMYTSFVKETTNHFMPGNLIDTHTNIYNELSIEEKIHHHESSIARRRATIDIIIEYHKRIIHDVDTINWNVGKEAKNIVNMEKSIHGKSDLSMKKLFSLFESASVKLKEYEVTLFKYAKLTMASKKSDSYNSRLIQIKALDFNYLIIEGRLKELKGDVHLLYTASKEIYNRRNQTSGKNTSENQQ
ncbi:hypothetical protein NEIRO03_2373 [Nematocida sp. AWRm78]|nr:hypothetical protein NEIRO02_2354 [Nematocida sp. AWRm79]KAI5186765.1 hypothetical protein NEIRO03_2373 [Nematocida sp. AWRm78]